jgi:hypothetical protein
VATIPYSTVLRTERLPVDAQDIVTKVRLVIAGNRAGRIPESFSTLTVADNPLGAGVSVDHFPTPIAYEYEAPEHATYGCARAFSLPEGFNPFLNPFDALVPEPSAITNVTNPGSPSAIRDGDPITFAEPTSYGSPGVIVYDFDAAIVGFRLRFVSVTSLFSDFLSMQMVRGRGGGCSTRAWHKLDAVDPELIYDVMPSTAQNELVNTSTVTGVASRGSLTLSFGVYHTDLRIFEFYPLMLNEALLLDVAKANVRLPAADPKRVTVRGYVAPDRSHTITGWPGGDFTGVVAQHQYELGKTVIDFEQAGAPVGLPAEAIESARERNTAITRAINTANYSLVMGERQ